MATDKQCDDALAHFRQRETRALAVDPPGASGRKRGFGSDTALEDWRVDMTILSAIISIAVLVPVAIALFAQQRQLRAAQMVGVRERHFELIKLMLEHPQLDYNATERDGTDPRLASIGMSLWVAHWNTLWHIDNLDEKALRFNLSDLFADPDARAWWHEVGRGWSSKGSKREQRFIEIVTEECASATVKASSTRPGGRVEAARSVGD